jgi:Zn-finger nucleic acid-binding protein
MSIQGIPAQRGGEPLRCPTCGSRLIEVERAEVLIDACPECRGVWLERGELDKILVRERQLAGGDADDDFLREVEGRPSAPPHDGGGASRGGGAKPSDREAAEALARKAFDAYKGAKHGKQKPRKKKGLLEQLLDF